MILLCNKYTIFNVFYIYKNYKFLVISQHRQSLKNSFIFTKNIQLDHENYEVCMFPKCMYDIYQSLRYNNKTKK